MLELLEKRHSVRSFRDEPLTPDLIDKIRSEITYINSHEAGLNFQVSFDDDAPFKGFGRSYGMFRNVKNYMAAVIDPTFPHTEERAGYFAEQFVLELVKIGLGTCFVGGTFSRDNVNARLEVYEKIPFVIAFGYPEENKLSLLGRIAYAKAHRKSCNPSDFLLKSEAVDESRINQSELEKALRAVALAPSALNKKPVRISMIQQDGQVLLTAGVKDYKRNAIELGIAKYNMANVLSGDWEWGNFMPFIPFNSL